MFYILHIPTATLLYNPCLKQYWGFKHKIVIDQLVDINCTVNLFSDRNGVISHANPQVDWENMVLNEFEIVEIL